jgi:hypothetical protein
MAEYSPMTEESKSKNPEVTVAKITAVQAVMVALIAAIGSVSVGYLTGRNTSNSSSTNSTEVVKQVANRFVTDRIEGDLQTTIGKQLSVPNSQSSEIFYRRLKRAVFLNLLSFQASDEILKRSLKSLEGRGQPITDVQINKLIAEMPELKRAKSRWLEDQAIPALLKEKESNSVVGPNQGPPPFAKVPLPDTIKILDQRIGVPTVIVDNMALLKEEVEVLKNNI